MLGPIREGVVKIASAVYFYNQHF